MFQSPSVRLQSSENAESMVQRKPGHLLDKKPFVDRAVNFNTPNEKQKQKLEIPTVDKPKLSPDNEELDRHEFMYSFKDMPDVCWTPHQFGAENLIKILRNYCHMEDTPPPSPEPAELDIQPMFMDVPDWDMSALLIEDIPNESFDVEAPRFDDIDFEYSY